MFYWGVVQLVEQQVLGLLVGVQIPAPLPFYKGVYVKKIERSLEKINSAGEGVGSLIGSFLVISAEGLKFVCQLLYQAIPVFFLSIGVGVIKKIKS